MSVEYFWTVGTMFSAGDNAHRSTILWHFVAPSLAVSILTLSAPLPPQFPFRRAGDCPPLRYHYLSFLLC